MCSEKGLSTASKQLTGLVAKVIGVDISPHMQPDDMPENLWLQVSDPEPQQSSAWGIMYWPRSNGRRECRYHTAMNLRWQRVWPAFKRFMTQDAKVTLSRSTTSTVHSPFRLTTSTSSNRDSSRPASIEFDGRLTFGIL